MSAIVNRSFFTLRLQAHFLTQVTLGKKTVEGRIFKPKYAHLSLGQTIRFEENDHPNRFVDVRIAHLNKYSSFRNMLIKERLENCLPGVNSIEEGVQVYHSIPDYMKEEREFGVLAMGIKILSQK